MKKNSYKAVLLTALGLWSVSAAQAENQSDLLVGFTDPVNSTPGGTTTSYYNDYVIDLGVTYSQLLTLANSDGGTLVIAANSTVGANGVNGINTSTFNSAYSSDASYLNDVNVGVVSADATATRSVFQTLLPSSNLSKSAFNNIVNQQASVETGEYASSTAGTGWSYLISQGQGLAGLNSANTWVANTKLSPMLTLVNGDATENLYESTQTSSVATPSPWSASLGTFEFNLNNDTITFISPAPEPTTYGLGAGVILLGVALRRQFRRKAA